MIGKALQELRARTSRAAQGWYELVEAAATKGREPALAALEAAAPEGLTGASMLQAFREDMASLTEVLAEEATLSRITADLDALDLDKAGKQAEKAEKMLAAANEVLSNHRRWSFAFGTRSGQIERMKAASPRLWPALAKLRNPEPETPAATLADIPPGEAIFVGD